MKRFLASIFLLGAMLASGSVYANEPDLQERVKQFESLVRETARSFNIPAPITVLPVSQAYQAPYGQAVSWTDWCSHSICGRNEHPREYFISVTTDFLLNWSALSIRHVAIHEVCHIRNGDIGVYREVVAKEHAAEQCVYDIVGHEEYVDHLVEAEKKMGREPHTREFLSNWALRSFGRE